MHFTVLYFKENKTLKDLNLAKIDEDFGSKFCYSIFEDEFIYDEETDDYVENPDFDFPEEFVCDVCDWFQVGGRWLNTIKASRGLTGEPSWTTPKETTGYTIVEVKDLDDEYLKTIDERFYGVATETDYFENGDPGFDEFMTKLKNRELVGVISLIDCHN